MTETALRRHWLHAIGVADAALTSAVQLRALTAEEAGRRRSLLIREREWLGAFHWSELGLSLIHI